MVQDHHKCQQEPVKSSLSSLEHLSLRLTHQKARSDEEFQDMKEGKAGRRPFRMIQKICHWDALTDNLFTDLVEATAISHLWKEIPAKPWLHISRHSKRHLRHCRSVDSLQRPSDSGMHTCKSTLQDAGSMEEGRQMDVCKEGKITTKGSKSQGATSLDRAMQGSFPHQMSWSAM